jgi:pimeloyl-ACP methyl ester carboxylesterase
MQTLRRYIPETGWFGVEANGLHFACFEEGTGPLLLLLHGFPDTPHTWDDARPRFAAAGYRVVTPFLRGYTPSGAPTKDDYGPETLGRDVLSLIKALGSERAIVLGHDWGAMSAYCAAALEPARVERLITVAIPPPTTVKPSLAVLWRVRHFIGLQLPGAAERFARNDYQGVRVMFERWSPQHHWPESELEAVKNTFSAPACLEAALGYYRAIRTKPPAFLKKRLSMPALIVGGKSDGILKEEDFQRASRGFEAGCRVSMLPGGHFLHREHPEPFIKEVLDFLKSS